MQTCRLELMGLHDTSAYRRHGTNLLRKANSSHFLSGWNIPNKKPGEPLQEWAATLLRAIPDREVTVHYSLKHQRCAGDPSEAFATWCSEMSRIGVSRVLLVTGPHGPQRDAVWVLEKLAGRHPAAGKLKLGVAFNACLPTEAEREQERSRLIRKLRTGLVDDVWFNTGVDEDLLERGITFVHELQEKMSLPRLEIFASGMLPSQAQLEQMRARPWNGVQFSDEFLSSVEGMWTATRKALSVFERHGVEPIIESKVKNAEDLGKLEELLQEQSVDGDISLCVDDKPTNGGYLEAGYRGVGSETVRENVVANSRADELCSVGAYESQARHDTYYKQSRVHRRRWGRGSGRA